MSQIDTSIPRVEVSGFACPLGVYPTDASAFEPLPGYFTEFEPADAGDDPDEGWEEWPDRYLFDIVITHKRLPALLRALFALLPGRVFPILDVLGHDAYREVDPYIAYDPVGFERFSDAHRRHRGWFLEDGLVGFGAMSIEPFVYVYVDEHKIVTVRAETALKERVERALAAFDLPQLDEPRGVDSVEHEHRETLIEPSDKDATDDASPAPPMHRDEIIDELREVWGLTMNIDPDRNLDDEGADLGNTAWRCVVRLWESDEDETPPRHAEAFLVAGSLAEAERLALEAAGEAATEGRTEAEGTRAVESEVIIADRITPEELAGFLGQKGGAAPLDATGVRSVRVLDDEPGTPPG